MKRPLTLCALAVGAAVAFFVVKETKPRHEEVSPAIKPREQVVTSDEKASPTPFPSFGGARSEPLAVKEVAVRQASKFEKEFEAFAAEYALTKDEKQKVLTAFYDAQESLKSAPRDGELASSIRADVRSDVYLQFAKDLLEILGGDRYERAMMARQPFAMLFEAEDSQALRESEDR